MEEGMQEIVMEGVWNAARNRTAIITSSQASPVQNADKICKRNLATLKFSLDVLDHGEIVEFGSHADLVSKNGLYAQMLKMEAPSQLPESNTELRKAGIVTRGKSFMSIPIEDANDNLRASQIEITRKPDSQAKKDDSPPIFRILSLCLTYWQMIALGTLAAICSGIAMTLMSWFFTEILISLALPLRDDAKLKNATRFWAAFIFGVAIISFLLRIIQYYALGMAGEKLGNSLRISAFRRTFSLPLSFFMLPENSPGNFSHFKLL